MFHGTPKYVSSTYTQVTRSKFNNGGKALTWEKIGPEPTTNTHGAILYKMFAYSEFNQDISSWDVGNVASFRSMFEGTDFNNNNQPITWTNIGTNNPYTSCNYTDYDILNQYGAPALGSSTVSFKVDFSSMFKYNITFNQGINTWNTGNVTTMSSMFYGCTSFNKPLNAWDTSNVTYMGSMFYGCENFNQYVSLHSENNKLLWDTSLVTDMSYMFNGCKLFNNGDSGVDNTHPVNFKTPLVNNMSFMFAGCESLNQKIGQDWKFDKITNLAYMFKECKLFNNSQTSNVNKCSPAAYDSGICNSNDVDNGLGSANPTTALVFSSPFGTDASKVNCSHMFYGCESLNTLIQIPSLYVKDMSSMFEGCKLFNKSVNEWDTSNVTTMASMFKGCSVFNQEINSWDTLKVTTMASMFEETTYNKPLIIKNNGTANLNCSRMFYNNSAFNSKITIKDALDVDTKLSAGSLIADMFYGAVKCNVDIDTITVNSVSVERSNTGVVVVEDSRKWSSTTQSYGLFAPTGGQMSIGTIAVVNSAGVRTFTFTPAGSAVTIPTTAVMRKVPYSEDNNPVYNGKITAFYTGTMYQNLNVTSGLVLRPTSNTIIFSSDNFNGGLYYARNKSTEELLSIPTRSGYRKLTLRINSRLGYGQQIIQIIRIGPQRALGEGEVIVGEFIMTVEEDPMICFKEGTKILTSTGYVPIEKLRQGQLVKTLNNNYLPIVFIGKKNVYHTATSERNPNQLYKYSRAMFPQLTDDLVITGKHSILVNQLSQSQKQKTMEIVGDNLLVDNKYKLPSCLDERASVYERQGNYNIYHLALQNENPHGSYGIYANGLLVESCSKFIMQYTDMELFTNKMPLLML